MPRAEATAFGCIDADESGRIREFIEKPADPPGTPDDPEQTFVSMGNYIFTTKVLIDAIRADADDDHSDHDMGGDIIPRLVADGMAAVYDFYNNEVPGATERDHGYWRDVGTLDAFYDAHMDLVSVHPVFNLYNRRWPIRSVTEAGFDATSVETGALGAGNYTYIASVAGNGNYLGDTSPDEPFTVDKAQLEITTEVHDAAHADITNGNVPLGSKAHDNATVTGGVTGFAIPAISFTLNGNPVNNGSTEAGFDATSVETGALGAGNYTYNASVAGNGNYIGDTSPDEPFTVDKAQLAITTEVHDCRARRHDQWQRAAGLQGTRQRDRDRWRERVRDPGRLVHPERQRREQRLDRGRLRRHLGGTGALGAGSYILQRLRGRQRQLHSATPVPMSRSRWTRPSWRSPPRSTRPTTRRHEQRLTCRWAPAHDNATVTGAWLGSRSRRVSFTFNGNASYNAGLGRGRFDAPPRWRPARSAQATTPTTPPWPATPTTSARPAPMSPSWSTRLS